MMRPRSTVGGLSRIQSRRRLASRRWAVFSPYYGHASPSWLWRSTLPRNRFCSKAVRPNRLPPSPQWRQRHVLSYDVTLLAPAVMPRCRHFIPLCPCPATMALPHLRLRQHHVSTASPACVGLLLTSPFQCHPATMSLPRHLCTCWRHPADVILPRHPPYWVPRHADIIINFGAKGENRAWEARIQILRQFFMRD